MATNIDSHSWAEPTTDADYHVRGNWFALGWAITCTLTISTFLILILAGWLKMGCRYLIAYLIRSNK